MEITIKQGQLIGTRRKTLLNAKRYYSFFGIPYAEPPLNSLRFKPPIPHKGWSGVLDATKPRSACYQRTPYISPDSFGSEDCLFVNVHVPQEPSNNVLKPVMVFVHGGGFRCEMGDRYQPDYLIEHDVVVVTFNYRLHVLGFLNLGLSDCPGNMGLKDQIMLFKWVRENIGAFGGDPLSVTAVAQSCGALCVHCLMISPQGKGLFDRVILQSGVVQCPSALTDDALKYAFELGKVLGCKTIDNKEELLHFLLQVPAAELSKAGSKVWRKNTTEKGYSDAIFNISIEYGHDLSAAVLTEDPAILARKATPIPTLSGTVDFDGFVLFTGDAFSKFFLNAWESEHIIPKQIRSNTKRHNELLDKIREHYNGKNTALEKPILKVETFTMVSDVYFNYPITKVWQNMLENHPTVPLYIYKFSYDGSLNGNKKMIQKADPNALQLEGATHSDELYYMYPLKITPECSPVKELSMIRNICTLWTNFIKYGTPSPPGCAIPWEPSTAKNPRYLHITQEGDFQMKNGNILSEERLNFWDKLIDNEKLRNTREKL